METCRASELKKYMDDFLFHRDRLTTLIQLKAISYSLLVFSLITTYLVVVYGTVWVASTFMIALVLMSISLPLSIFSFFLSRFHARRKKNLAKFFFEQGLRVEDNKLVTNDAHSEVRLSI